MRAVTGAVVSSKPCSLAKATRILALFADSAASDLPSSDAATYLRAATEAASDLHVFRRDLRRYQQQGGDGADAYEGVGRGVGGESETKQKRQRRAREAGGEEDGVTVRAAVSQGDVSEQKSNKKKGAREDEEPREEKQGEDEEIAAPHIGLHSPASEKRKKKKEKHVKQENETGNVNAEENRKALENGLQDLLSKEGIDKEKKEKKKKKHVKQEEEVRGVKEPEQKMVHVGVAEHGLASEEKKSKKRKHTEEEEEKKGIVTDGDLGSDKKRKKKRERDGDNGNNMELVEHTKKKQRK